MSTIGISALILGAFLIATIYVMLVLVDRHVKALKTLKDLKKHLSDIRFNLALSNMKNNRGLLDDY